jgi:hypothetical protein
MKRTTAHRLRRLVPDPRVDRFQATLPPQNPLPTVNVPIIIPRTLISTGVSRRMSHTNSHRFHTSRSQMPQFPFWAHPLCKASFSCGSHLFNNVFLFDVVSLPRPPPMQEKAKSLTPPLISAGCPPTTDDFAEIPSSYPFFEHLAPAPSTHFTSPISCFV